MKFSSKIVAALMLTGVAAQGGKRGSSSSSSPDMSMSGKKGGAPEHVIDLACPAGDNVPTCAAPTPAQEDPAGEGFSNIISTCLNRITAPGIYYLEDDVTCEEGDFNAIAIGGNGGDSRVDGTVVIDCQGNTLDGNGFAARGIAFLNADDVVIKNCGIKNFLRSGIGSTDNAGPSLVINNVVSTKNGNDGLTYLPQDGDDGDEDGTERVTITNSNFDGNVRNGATIELDGHDDDDDTITILDSTFNGNGANGLVGPNDSDDGDTKYILSGVEANGNGERGIMIDLDGDDDDESVDLLGVEACNNDQLEMMIADQSIMITGNDDAIVAEGVTCIASEPPMLCACTCDVEMSSSGGKKGGSSSSSPSSSSSSSGKRRVK